MSSVSDIKLIRTDTTLDLSQKAEKRCPSFSKIGDAVAKRRTGHVGARAQNNDKSACALYYGTVRQSSKAVRQGLVMHCQSVLPDNHVFDMFSNLPNSPPNAPKCLEANATILRSSPIK